jgi:hypothetical protein
MLDTEMAGGEMHGMHVLYIVWKHSVGTEPWSTVHLGSCRYRVTCTGKRAPRHLQPT